MTPSFAIVTPSFAPDFERCRLLAESFVRHGAPHLRHYIVVDRRDERLFSALKGPRTEIVVKQDILPGRFFQLPITRKWWLDLSGKALVRGWILQQITKLSAPSICKEDICIFIDSDAFLVRDYDPRDSLRGELAPMFREILPSDDEAFSVQWHQVAARLFGLPQRDRYATNYVSQLVTWRRENVLRMHEHIERITGRSWWEAISGCSTVSEYMLYGIFCEQILKEDARHYWQDQIDVLCVWDTQTLDETGVRRLRYAIRPEHAAVMISAKSHTPVSTIRQGFDL